MDAGRSNIEVTVRWEAADDGAAVRDVLLAAFEGPDEARIVEDLRRAGAISSCVVAEKRDGEGCSLVGVLVFSPVSIRGADGRVVAAWGLGPMAVAPELQRGGVGEQMLEFWRREGPKPPSGIVVVLGHAAYYPRFGFRRASQFGVRWEHPCPDEAFLLLETEPGAADDVEGVVSYHGAFG